MKIIIVGDKSRYQFLWSLLDNLDEVDLSTDELAKETIYITSNNVTDKNKYHSSKMPRETELVFPGEFSNDNMSISTNDMVLFFDEFPFRMKSELNDINKFMQRTEAFYYNVILINNNRNYLKTDISDEQDAIDKAIDAFKKENISVYVLDNMNDTQILYYNPKFLLKSSNELYKIKIKHIKRDVNVLFDDMYMIDCIGTGIDDIKTNPARREQMLAYRRQYNCSDLSREYIKVLNDFLIVVFKKIVIKEYDKYIKDICVWDYEKDKSLLIKDISDEFISVKFEPISFYGSEEEYNVRMNEKVMVDYRVKFWNRVIAFCDTDMKNIIKDRIMLRLSRLEEAIDEEI